MRKLTEGEEMPYDFWNYKVNPIVGYYIPKMDDHSVLMEKKYNKVPQGI